MGARQRPETETIKKGIFLPLAIDKRGFKIGAEMEMKIETLWREEDKEVLGYHFRRD